MAESDPTRSEKRARYAAVYVIASGPLQVKIGVSSRPHSRLAALQTAAVTHLELAGYIHRPTRTEAFQLERRAHTYLAGNRIQGEWFECEPWQAMELIKTLAAGLPIDTALLPQPRRPPVLKCPHCGHTAETEMMRAQIATLWFKCSNCAVRTPGARMIGLVGRRKRHML